MKIAKHVLLSLFTLLILTVIFPASALAAPASDLSDLAIGTWAGNGDNPGDGHRYIDMGSYNGYPLKWRVLDVYISDGTDGNIAGRKTALLFLDDVLRTASGAVENRIFDSTYPAADCGNWARPSDIKAFLNGAFYTAAFSADEQVDIITASYTMGGPYEGQFGFPTNDSSKIFLLSTDEVTNSTYFANNADRTAANFWWLRSPGSSYYGAADVNTGGTVYGNGNVVVNLGVRPALKLDLSSVLFTSADYSAVEAAIAAASALDRNIYVSFAGVDAAIAAVVYGLDITQQTVVDGFAAGINAAVAALQIKTYAVKFVDWDGTVLKTQVVEHGTAAIAPEPPAREGFTFANWDKDFSNVTEDLTVNALYYGISAEQPGITAFPAAVVGYSAQAAMTCKVTNTGTISSGTLTVVLIGANPGAFALSTNSLASIPAKNSNSFTVWPVTGLNAGTYTATIRIYNSNASHTLDISFTVNKTYPILTLNTPANNAAYTYPQDVTLSATLTGVYPNSAGKTVTFTAGGTNYTAVTNSAGVATFTIVSPDAAVYALSASYVGDANNNAAISASRYYTVNKTSPALTLTAVPQDISAYTESVLLTATLAGALPSSADRIITFMVNGTNYDVLTDGSGVAIYTVTDLAPEEYIFAVSFAGDTNNNAAAAGPLSSYKVTFVDWNGYMLKTQVVNRGGGATAPAEPDNKYGWHFVEWDNEYDNITGPTTVTALYEINTYTVTFLDWDGAVLSEQIIEHGSAASEPDSPTRTGYTFTDWDEDFSCITADLIVIALYEINIYTVSFYKQSQNNSNQVAKTPFATQQVTYNELIDFTNISVGKNAVWYYTDGTTFGAKFDINTLITGDIMLAVKDQNSNQQ